MGENEQGGMLRTVVVVGIVALIAAVVIGGVVGMKASMNKNTDKAVGVVAKTKVPYGVQNVDVTYGKYTAGDNGNWGRGKYYSAFPLVGDIPNNSWREDRLVVNASERIYISIDINDYYESALSNRRNDNDDRSKRLLEVYDENGNKVSSNDPGNNVYLDKDKDYTLIVKYFNNSGGTLTDGGVGVSNSTIISGTDDGRRYRLKIKSFEAATYDDKYTK